MSKLTALIARVVNRWPVAVLIGLALLTAGAGLAATQQVQEQQTGEGAGGEASDAADVIEERFTTSGAPLQVLVRTPGSDVRNAEALTVLASIQSAVNEGPVADRLLSAGGAPPVLGFLTPALEASRAAGLDPAEIDDQRVRELQQQALEQLPQDLANQTDDLLGDGDPPSAGLVLILLDVAELDEEARLEVEQQVADVINEVEVPEGVTVEPFSVLMMLEEGDVGAEVGQLFGIALALIVILLGLVFWVRPERGARGRIARRTAADVGLAVLAILGAIVWMQGIGVLLGPDYAGLIGYFSPQTQVVPIIIVGLGVDYAIHLQTRYRSGLAAGDDPGESNHLAARTVGVALALATATTAIGFLTNLTSPFEALATLGVLAAVGIGAAFVMTLTAIPAVRVLLDRRAIRRDTLPLDSLANRGRGALHRVAGSTAALAERGPWVVVGVALVLAAAGGWGFTRLSEEFSFTDFVPDDSEMLATLETIEDEFGGGFGERTDVLLQGDLATVEAHDALVESVQGLGEIEDVQELGDQPDVRSPISALRAAMAADEDLAGTVESLGAGDDLRLGGTDATDSDVADLYSQTLEVVPDQATEVVAEVDGDYSGRVSIGTNVDTRGAVGLAEAVSQAFGPVAATGVEVTPTSQEIIGGRLTERIQRSQLVSIAIAVSVVLVLLTAYYAVAHRRPLLGPVAIIPVLLVLAWTFGAMALFGIPLTPVTATLAALSIGVGIDFSIHVVNRFQEEAEAQPDADDSELLRMTTGETGSALLGSALTTVLGFGVLMTSNLVPFQQLGQVTVLAIGFALLAALLVLPSILRLVRRHRW